MNNEEQAYDAAGEALVDWVDTHKDTVDGPLLCIILLEKAISLSFYCLGHDTTMEAVDGLMRQMIQEHTEDSMNN